MAVKWWTLIAVSVATFMLLLDITVVNTALPSIQHDLHSSFTDLQWVIDAYTLSMAAVVMTSGSLADRFGRRLVFAVGLVIFTIASLAAALAGDPTMLNLSRGVQGIGGAAMFAVSLALLAQEFEAGRERGMAMGIYGATIGVAVAIGPLLGGVITSGLGWRWVFYLNVPIGIAAVAVAMTKLRESSDPNATRVDWGGLVTLSASLFMLVLALVRGNEEGWGSTLIVGLFAGAAALFAAFVVIEQRVSQPMLPLDLFRRRAFTGVQLAAAGISSTMFALFLYMTLYMQSYLGLSPAEAGVRYLPLSAVVFVVAPISGMLLSRVQARYLMAVGLVAVAGGLGMVSTVDTHSTWTALLPGFVLMGAGAGILNPAIADVALSVVSKDRSGMASGINDTFRQVGISIGVAAWGAIFLGSGANKIASVAAGTPTAVGSHPRQLLEATTSGHLAAALQSVPAGSRGIVEHAAREGFITGFDLISILGGLVALVGAGLALWLVREHEIEREGNGLEPVGREREPVLEPSLA